MNGFRNIFTTTAQRDRGWSSHGCSILRKCRDEESARIFEMGLDAGGEPALVPYEIGLKPWRG